MSTQKVTANMVGNSLISQDTHIVPGKLQGQAEIIPVAGMSFRQYLIGNALAGTAALPFSHGAQVQLTEWARSRAGECLSLVDAVLQLEADRYNAQLEAAEAVEQQGPGKIMAMKGGRA